MGGAQKPEVRNHARSGNKSWELINQVREVKSTETPVVAFYFLGHNDLCTNEDTPETFGERYQNTMREALQEWDRRHQKSVVYLMPIGEISRVYETLDGYVWRKTAAGSFSCQDSWMNYFPYCRSYYQKHVEKTLRSELEPKITQMNASLSRLALELTGQSSGNRFYYLEGINQGPYRPKDFAVDCFHLSSNGQKVIAEAVYHAIKE